MADEVRLSIGAVLRQVRQEQRLPLRELERRANLPHGYLGAIETGRRPPKPELIVRVAETLGLDKEWTNMLLALAMGERLEEAIYDYIEVLERLPVLEYEIGLSPLALEVFRQGWREPVAISALAQLASGGAWTLQLTDPQGRRRAWWEFPSSGRDSTDRNSDPEHRHG